MAPGTGDVTLTHSPEAVTVTCTHHSQEYGREHGGMQLPTQSNDMVMNVEVAAVSSRSIDMLIVRKSLLG